MCSPARAVSHGDAAPSHIGCCPWPSLGGGHYQRARITEGRPSPKDEAPFLLYTQGHPALRFSEMTQGLSPTLPLPHLPGSPTVRAAGSQGSPTLSPCLLPVPPEQPNRRVHNQPAILKPRHSTIQTVATPFPFPRGDGKGRGTPGCLPEGTRCYPPPHSDTEDSCAPSGVLPFHVAPAPA